MTLVFVKPKCLKLSLCAQRDAEQRCKQRTVVDAELAWPESVCVPVWWLAVSPHGSSCVMPGLAPSLSHCRLLLLHKPGPARVASSALALAGS